MHVLKFQFKRLYGVGKILLKLPWHEIIIARVHLAQQRLNYG